MRLGRTVACNVRLDMRGTAVRGWLTSVMDRHGRVGVTTDRRVLLRRIRRRRHVLLGASIVLAIIVLPAPVVA